MRVEQADLGPWLRQISHRERETVLEILGLGYCEKVQYALDGIRIQFPPRVQILATRKNAKPADIQYNSADCERLSWNKADKYGLQRPSLRLAMIYCWILIHFGWFCSGFMVRWSFEFDCEHE